MAQTIPGTLRVSNDVIADLAGYAALECYGVVGMAYTDAQDNIVRLLSLGSLRKAVFDGDTANGSLMAGQAAGLLHEVRPVAQILDEMVSGARQCIATLTL